MSIGAVNQISSNIFHYDFIIKTLKNIEALTSARIEGTTGNLEDLYQHDELKYEIKKELKLFSALNYTVTIDELEEILKRYERIDIPVIQYLHKKLTENDPSTKGIPGKFREKDVKIENSLLGDFYPASHLKINEFMQRFVNNNEIEIVPDLIKIGIRHFQFESIHPFEDGNGRTGRLLITAGLLKKGIIASPIINLSEYFDSHRDEYVLALRKVSDLMDYNPWLEYFLDAIKFQCSHNIKLISLLRKMQKEDKQKITSNVKLSSNALSVLDFSLNNLFITIPQVAEHLKTLSLPIKEPYQTARNNIHTLEKLGILKAHHKSKHATVYVHEQLRSLIIK